MNTTNGQSFEPEQLAALKEIRSQGSDGISLFELSQRGEAVTNTVPSP